MSLTYVQSDTAATLGTVSSCSGLSVSATPGGKLAVNGGGAGSTPFNVGHSGSSSGVAALMFEFAPGLARWDAGTWTIPVNVTSDGGDDTIAGSTMVWVCRRTVAGAAVHTVGSWAEVESTSVAVHTFSQSLGLSLGSATDLCYIVIGYSFDSSHTVQVTPDQTITTPLVAVSEEGPGPRFRAYGKPASVVRAVGG